jgi:nitrate/TMAO reductase-like tetraheme cytochrome c subunit
MKALAKRLFLIAVALVLSVIGYFVVGLLSRDHPESQPSTVHSTLSRESCIECHAPIAAEWRQSFHYLSVTGPFWGRIRAKRFDSLFELLRVPCMNCHAPADVLDLPEGSFPAVRTDALALGVDCVSCHVSKQGIMGPGHSVEAPHDMHADERFRDANLASTVLCGHCHEEIADHGKVVTAWKRTSFAEEGVTCLDCHMPMIEAPVVEGGLPRSRRSHRFLGDKDKTMLNKALNASIVLAEDKQAIVRIVNDRVGHSFPAAGTNWLLVRVTVEDEEGRVVEEKERGFGTREWIPGYLDFWPFVKVSKIHHGEQRDIAVQLPSTHGQVSAEFRYRDWFAVTDKDLVFATITKKY